MRKESLEFLQEEESLLLSKTLLDLKDEPLFKKLVKRADLKSSPGSEEDLIIENDLKLIKVYGEYVFHKISDIIKSNNIISDEENVYIFNLTRRILNKLKGYVELGKLKRVFGEETVEMRESIESLVNRPINVLKAFNNVYFIYIFEKEQLDMIYNINSIIKRMELLKYVETDPQRIDGYNTIFTRIRLHVVNEPYSKDLKLLIEEFERVNRREVEEQFFPVKRFLEYKVF